MLKNIGVVLRLVRNEIRIAIALRARRNSTIWGLPDIEPCTGTGGRNAKLCIQTDQYIFMTIQTNEKMVDDGRGCSKVS